MTAYGQASRAPVLSGGRRVPGLYERVTRDGRTTFESRVRVDGRTKRHTLRATTKTDAIHEHRALQTDYARGEMYRSAAAGSTVREVSEEWLALLDARTREADPRRRYSANTVAVYRLRLEKHVLPVLGATPIADVSVAQIRRLASKLSTSMAPSSASVVLATTSGLFRHAVRDGLVERNPVRELDRDDRPGARRRTEPRYLTAVELATLLAALGDTWRPVAAVCAYAGLRISEALGLRWCDVDLKAGTIDVSGQLGRDGERAHVKTEAAAAPVPILPALARELKAHRARVASSDLRRVHADAFVFTTSRGRPQSRRNALRALHAAGDRVGLNPEGREKVGLHDLRHTYCALALDAGASLAEVAALARHADARVTATVYAGIADDGRSKAAEKLKAAGFGA